MEDGLILMTHMSLMKNGGKQSQNWVNPAANSQLQANKKDVLTLSRVGL